MNVFTFPLRYLWLVDQDMVPLFVRNGFAALSLAILLSVPFWLTGANYFGENGLLNQFGAFSGVLTGFYVAALVAVATFASTSVSLDEEMKVGPVMGPAQEGSVRQPLTRRQYVSAMFGYLSFISLTLSLFAILIVSIAGSITPILVAWVGATTVNWIGCVVLFGINLLIAHMVVTTCHGLYYLIDRMYAPKSVLLNKDGEPTIQG